jgi:hypothetical protein
MPPGVEPGVEWADDTDAADTDDTDATDDDEAAAEELDAIEELTESRMVVSVIKLSCTACCLHGARHNSRTAVNVAWGISEPSSFCPPGVRTQ